MTIVLVILCVALASWCARLGVMNARLARRVAHERRWRIEAYRWMDVVDPPARPGGLVIRENYFEGDGGAPFHV
jgi:hypothetical protein